MLENILNEIPYKKITVPPKIQLLGAGEKAQYIYYVHSGCIRLSYNSNGKDITCQFFFEGNYVISIESFIKSAPSEYSIESVLPSVLYVIKGEDIKKWLQNNPQQMDCVLDIAFERMIHYSKLFLSRIKESPQERYNSLVKEHPEIVKQIPQHYIATYLGISPVSLSRIRSRK